MSELPGEVAGLPVGGPATLAAVKQRLRIAVDDTTRDDDLGIIIAAVNDQVRTYRIAQMSVDQADWRDSTILGAVMLCVRLDARRNSPEGVAEFGSEGPVYVQRNDPDVAQLLGLGQWAPPVAR